MQKAWPDERGALIVHRRSWAGEVVYLVNLQNQLFHYIVSEGLKVGLVQQVLYILLAASEEVIDADYLQEGGELERGGSSKLIDQCAPQQPLLQRLGISMGQGLAGRPNTSSSRVQSLPMLGSRQEHSHGRPSRPGMCTGDCLQSPLHQ